MKVLIVGSGGYVGKRLFEYLRQTGIQTYGVSSSKSGGIDPLTGIMSDDFSIPPETSTVIYLAVSPYYRKVPEMSQHLLNVNVLSAVKVAELSRKANVQRFIYASTGNVYAQSFDPLSENAPLRRDNWYSVSKVFGEESLSLFRDEMEIIIMRIFGIYGPAQTGKLVPHILNSVREDKEIFIERSPLNDDDRDGLKISLCYIDNAVQIMNDLILNGGPSYINVAGDNVISIRAIAEKISEYLNKKSNLKVLNRRRTFDLIADISLLQRTVNPAFTSFDEGIKKTVEYILP
jgi:nucleoside-diphosphate-sugar epimerase